MAAPNLIFAVQTAFMVLAATPAALGARDASKLEDGARGWTAAQRDEWALVKNAVAGTVADGITIVAATGGGPNAFWMRQQLSEVYWAYQATWYQDSVAGNDDAQGDVLGAPVKTVAEIARRLRFGKNGTTYVVNVLNDVPVTDSFTPNTTLVGAGSATTTTLTYGTTFQFLGQRTTTRSGTFAAGTQQTDPTRAAATAQAEAVDAGVASWATDVGNLIVNQDGKTAWVISAKGGGNTARVGDWVTSAFAWTATPPAAGNTYSVVTLTRWRAPFGVQGQAQGAQTLTAPILFDNFHFDNIQLQRLVYGSSSIVFARTCKFSNEQALLAGAATNTFNLPTGLVQNARTRLVISAGMLMNYGTGVAAPTLSLSGSSTVFNPGSVAYKCRFFMGDGPVFFQGMCIQGGWIQVGTSTGESPGAGVNFGSASSNGFWNGIYNDFDLPAGSGIAAAIQVGKTNSACVVNSIYGVGDGVTVIRGLYVRDSGKVTILSTIFEQGSGSETTTTCWNLQPSAGAAQIDINALVQTMTDINAAAGAVLPVKQNCTTFNNYRVLFTRNMLDWGTGAGVTKFA